ncbi:MAG: hypothetical protein WCI62_02105, partial [Erysipelotrichaceae bacterium]
MSQNLKKIKDALSKHPNQALINYAIPDLWLGFDYKGPHIKTNDGHVLVNPYHFYASLIEDVYLTKSGSPLSTYYLNHPSIKGYMNGNWIRRSSVYSMMIRTS